MMIGDNMRLAVVGAGKAAAKVLSYPLKKGIHIVGIYDNSSEKWGSKLCGYTISSVESLADIQYDKVLLAAIVGGDGVKSQLLGQGVPEEKIIWALGWSKAEYMSDELDQFFDVPKKQLIPFEKKSVVSFWHCGGVSRKAHKRRERERFFQKYCQGEGLDIGCGNDPVIQGCYGWDIPHGDAQYLASIPSETLDYVHSSHCIEHMADVRIALKNWFRVVKYGGYLLLYLPDRDLYEKRKRLPSHFNPYHRHMFLLGAKEPPDTLDIMEEIRETLQGEPYRVIYAKTCDDGHTITDPCIHSDGEYSIEVVIQKTRSPW